MATDRKMHFVDELKKHYREIISGAYRAETDAGEAAEQIRGEARSRDDAKGAAQFGRMEAEHRKRRERSKQELETLIAFAARGIPAFTRGRPVGLGALVDVSIEGDDGAEERTLFVLPVGAGVELHGPGGDGFVSVVTPASPVGRALSGARPEDSFEIVVGGFDREWTVVDLC